MPEKLTHCPLCNSNDLEHFLECTDHFVSGELFEISSCNNCGFHFTNPRPLLQESFSYYESESYVSHSKTSAGLINRLFHFARNFTLTSKKRVVGRYATKGKILDYGCGTGEFLNTMNKAGWNSSGIEPGSSARTFAIENYKLNVQDEDALPKIENNSFNAITLWHVLEHVYPLHERLKNFYSLLKDEGILFVAVPNMSSYDAKHYGSHWAAYDVPRHLYHFNPVVLKQLMQNSGFEFIAQKPMPLDAFYISLLSEKYKHGKNRFHLALLNGLLSNCMAFLGRGNYSSLIYIFKKS